MSSNERVLSKHMHLSNGIVLELSTWIDNHE